VKSGAQPINRPGGARVGRLDGSEEIYVANLEPEQPLRCE